MASNLKELKAVLKQNGITRKHLLVLAAIFIGLPALALGIPILLDVSLTRVVTVLYCGFFVFMFAWGWIDYLKTRND